MFLYHHMLGLTGDLFLMETLFVLDGFIVVGLEDGSEELLDAPFLFAGELDFVEYGAQD
jgi:hypothetical protein